MNIKYPLIIPIIGHGSTDILDFPVDAILCNFYVAILVYNLGHKQRKFVLLISSIYHMALDIPFKYKYVYSSLIHGLWLYKPIIAKLHLLLFHTPLHYYKIYLMKHKWRMKFLLGGLTSIIGGIFLSKNKDKAMDKKYGELWWTSPVLAHVLLTEKMNYVYKRNTLYKLRMKQLFGGKIRFI